MDDDVVNDDSSSIEDGEARRVSRRDALRKAAAGAAVAGVAWSAPAVKGLTVVPDYASAGTATGLTKVFRILGVERNSNQIDVDSSVHDFRGLPTPDVTVSGGYGTAPYSPATGQVLENGPAGFPGSLVTMTAPLGVAGNVSATMQNNPTAFFRADAASNNGGSIYTAPERIQIPVTFSVDPPFNTCKVASGTLFRSNSYNAANNVWDLNPVTPQQHELSIPESTVGADPHKLGPVRGPGVLHPDSHYWASTSSWTDRHSVHEHLSGTQSQQPWGVHPDRHG